VASPETNESSHRGRRTQVAIIGGGPAGLMLARRLQLNGHEAVIVERQARDHVLARIRAGVLEWGTVGLLRDAGVADRMDAEGFVHEGVGLSYLDRHLRVDFRKHTGGAVMVYGQTQITRDLYEALEQTEVRIVDEADEVALHDVDRDHPYVTYEHHGEIHRLDCEYIAGCDGSHGVCRSAIPAAVRREYERVYPFGWVGILSQTPPIDDELIYAHSERGFALCSMRHAMLSRYYVQCPLDDTIDDWSDDRFWSELTARLPAEFAARLVTGPSIEKSITPLRSFVSEPMSYGRLFLAGDAAHVVPPTGAKGLNLAMSDVHYLASALGDALSGGSTTGLESYSATALARVWKAVRFSWWMTNLMHLFPDDSQFGPKVQQAELDYLSSSQAAQVSMAENYIGLPL
jgi:p-hydroxybenzoate 3-monooxygenase